MSKRTPDFMMNAISAGNLRKQWGYVRQSIHNRNQQDQIKELQL